MNFRRAAVLGIALSAVAPSSALAVDDKKPTPCGYQVKDADADTVGPAGTTGGSPANLEILEVFVKHDASKGDEATTMNIVIKDLNQAVPAGATGLNWTVSYMVGDTQRFVRAVRDYTGSVIFEHGMVVDLEATTTSVPSGQTPGKLFEGPNGVIQIVVPKEFGAAGAKIDGVSVVAGASRQAVPNAIQTPTRGLSSIYDRVPDEANTFSAPFMVSACDPAPAAPAAPVAAPPAPTAAGPLPLTLTSKSVKAPKGKSLKLKIKASEALTKLSFTLTGKGKKVGAGSLAKLNGAGTVTLKLSTKLKKGSYELLASGTDSKGAKRTTKLKLTVK